MKSVQKWVRNTLAVVIAGTSASAATIQVTASEPPALTQALAMNASPNAALVNHNVISWSDNASAEVTIEDQFLGMQQRLAELEAGLEEVAEEAGDKSIVHSGSSKSTMKVIGRVHVDAWGFDPTGGDVAALNSKDGSPVDPQTDLVFDVCDSVSKARFGTT